jgi:hypothetical protein
MICIWPDYHSTHPQQKEPANMPKSLSEGVSEQVHVKIPATEKAALFAALRDGETISKLTRELWRKEVVRRKSTPKK